LLGVSSAVRVFEGFRLTFSSLRSHPIIATPPIARAAAASKVIVFFMVVFLS
jgi:hypothetical protein